LDDPNYTQIPNQLLGSWERNGKKDSVFIPGAMSDMSESELKVCLALCRLTYGFHRINADGSIGFLVEMTGMSRQGVLNGIERLVGRGFFSRSIGSNGVGVWQREVAEDELPEGSLLRRPPLVNEVDQGSQRSRPNKERIKKEKEKRLSETAKPPPAEVPDNYTVTYYYKDREHVSVIGKATTGPWRVQCPDCGGDVQIDELDARGTECYCGMHEFVLLRHKPKVSVSRYSDAVEAYYGIARARGIKYGSMTDWHGEIDKYVTDVSRWRRVVKEYIAQNGWSPMAVDKMLTYYRENRLPGSRKKGQKKPDKPYDAADAHFGKLEQTPIPEGMKLESVEVRDEDGRLKKVVQKLVPVEEKK
jgi:hypothetical protein